VAGGGRDESRYCPSPSGLSPSDLKVKLDGERKGAGIEDSAGGEGGGEDGAIRGGFAHCDSRNGGKETTTRPAGRQTYSTEANDAGVVGWVKDHDDVMR
jgi:hypothetical protein